MERTMRFFDTHAHFGLNPGANAVVMQRAEEAGVSRLVAVGGSRDLNAAAMAVKEVFPARVVLALGFDRSQAGGAAAADYIATLRELHRVSEAGAVGETGLDFHYERDTAVAQCELFAAHLALAGEWRRPVSIHTREADAATLRVLDESPWSGEGLRGVVHCFTGSRDFARELLDRQLAVSFSGIVTFRNAGLLRESAAFVPDERLLIETDAPYLAPVPMRGRQNEPAFVTHVAACLAQVRGVSQEHVAAVTTRNAEALFGGWQPQKRSSPKHSGS
jgi:TatD DNase family protein